MRTRIINKLLRKYNINYKEVYDCSVERAQDIAHAGQIFALENFDDQKLCLALVHLLAPESAEKITGLLRQQNDLTLTIDSEDVQASALFLLTACIYNPSFFTIAWNLCGFARMEAEKQLQEKPITVPFPVPVYEFVHVAAGAEGMGPIGEAQIIPVNGIPGKLILKGDDPKGEGRICFIYQFPKDIEPFPVKLHYTVNGKQHEAVLDNPVLNNPDRISSITYTGIDFSGVVKVTGIEAI